MTGRQLEVLRQDASPADRRKPPGRWGIAKDVSTLVSVLLWGATRSGLAVGQRGRVCAAAGASSMAARAIGTVAKWRPEVALVRNSAPPRGRRRRRRLGA